MKINQLNSWFRISIIYLFILNASIVTAAFLLDNDVLSLLAVLLSIFQVFWYNYYRRKCSVLPFYPFRAVIMEKMNHFPFSLSGLLFKGNEWPRSLSRKQCRIIKKRAACIPSGIITGTLNHHPSDPGFERVRPEKYPVEISCRDLRVEVGTAQCLQPYRLSVLNIGASERANLSGATLIALSEGAKISDCAINTGRIGINQYLIRGGGDIIWQITSACYNTLETNDWPRDLHLERSAGRPYVKMLEIKLSAEEQSAIKREGNACQLLFTVRELRSLSGGKPVGINLDNPEMDLLGCICNSILSTGIYIDFFTVEGNKNNYTGACDNAILFRSLSNTRKALRNYGLTSSVIASGNIVTEYDILRAIALGADACYCIEPMIEATGSGHFLKKADALTRRVGVANYHRNTVEATVKLMEFCSYKTLSDVTARDFHRRINLVDNISLEEVYHSQKSARYNTVYISMN